MVDVLHYFFEEDMSFTSQEQAEAQSKTRENLYSTMYGMTYKYAYKSKQQNQPVNFDDIPTEDSSDMADIKPFDPKKEPTKAYIPPTDFDPTSSNPFGNGLDAPMR